MINKTGNLRRGMTGIEPTPSKSCDWKPLSPCQLSLGGNCFIASSVASLDQLLPAHENSVYNRFKYNYFETL